MHVFGKNVISCENYANVFWQLGGGEIEYIHKLYQRTYVSTDWQTKLSKVASHLKVPTRGGRHTFGGLVLPLRWVAPATISQKWSWNRKKGRRHATLWSISFLFCFIIFFYLYVKNWSKMSSRIRGANSKNETAGFSSPNISESCSKWVLAGNFWF